MAPPGAGRPVSGQVGPVAVGTAVVDGELEAGAARLVRPCDVATSAIVPPTTATAATTATTRQAHEDRPPRRPCSSRRVGVWVPEPRPGRDGAGGVASLIAPAG